MQTELTLVGAVQAPSIVPTRPTRAGAARIEHVLPDQMRTRGVPIRDKETIFLPAHKNNRFYPLKSGEQFLVTVDNLDTQYREGDRRLFFGGMDESPFLVELEIEAIEHLVQGEDAFYHALKPATIRFAEEKLGAKVVRQGDIFAAQPYRNLADLLKKNTKGGARATIVSAENTSLFGTRHTFKGLYGRIEKNGQTVDFGEGLLSAPDHDSLTFRAPHIFEQSLFLKRPREAD